MKRGIKPGQFAERDKRIAETYLSGKTLRQVAKEFNLNFERIRQILMRDGVQLRAHGSGK